MSVYFVAMQDVKDQAKLDQYLEKVGTTLPADLKVLSIDAEPELIEGSATRRTVLLEFDSREDFRRWYDSDAYQAIAQLRKDAGPATVLLAEGFVPPSD